MIHQTEISVISKLADHSLIWHHIDDVSIGLPGEQIPSRKVTDRTLPRHEHQDSDATGQTVKVERPTVVFRYYG
jgi:hypothetical protein